MGWINLNSILLQLLSTLASIHCIEEHDIYPFSEALNSGMENETNPCNDFYQYSCGKWIERNEELETLKPWNVYGMSALSTLIKMKEILDNPKIDENNEKLSLEKKFYEACMDEDYSATEGLKLILNIAYGIPQERWQDVLEYYATNFSAFNLFHIKLDKTKRLQIERPLFSKSNKNVFNHMKPELITTLKMLYAKGGNFFGDVRPMEVAVIESLHFMEFINQITRNGNKTREVYSILKLQEFYDYECPSKHAKIEWLKFFQKLAKGSGINFTLEDELAVDSQYLISLCKRLNSTPAHAIVNYLQTNFLLDDESLFEIMSYKRKLSYIQRYIRCIRTLPITEGITEEILKSHIIQGSQKYVYEMFNNIKSALIKEIENSWLLNSLKEILLNRTRRITFKYGTSVNFLKEKLGGSVTYEFEIGGVAFQNKLNLKRAQIMNILQIYNRVYKVHREKRHAVCNAFYSRSQNEIVIEVAMLFPAFFSTSAPIAFNYGRLGFIIGHEISHSCQISIIRSYIDCIPSEDERNKMKALLNRKGVCFLKEFNNFGIDGLRTLYENMADTQGLKLAWKGMNAFIQDREKRGEELPSSEYWNEKKVFFLSFANIWCSKPEYRRQNVDDRHAPHVIRNLGTLMNMKEFEETYECAEGDFMNPITKCDLWDES